mmetsp:Transcript_15329/g.33649  ORF Transcript_15329/g.33649 Transcript_15329/m.33649 type:complete len:224 (+) Transcript_15329:1046-1717(+)
MDTGGLRFRYNRALRAIKQPMAMQARTVSSRGAYHQGKLLSLRLGSQPGPFSEASCEDPALDLGDLVDGGTITSPWTAASLPSSLSSALSERAPWRLETSSRSFCISAAFLASSSAAAFFSASLICCCFSSSSFSAALSCSPFSFCRSEICCLSFSISESCCFLTASAACFSSSSAFSFSARNFASSAPTAFATVSAICWLSWSTPAGPASSALSWLPRREPC